MSDKYVINKSTLEGIGNAIRNKKGTSDLIPVPDLASEIASIPSGITPTGSLTITENGTYNVESIAQVIANIAGGVEGYIIEAGEFTPYEDLLICQSRKSDSGVPSHNPFTIQHNLGAIPDLFFVDGDFSNSSTPVGVVTHAHGYKYVITTAKRTKYNSYITRVNGSSNNSGISVDVDNPTIRDTACIGFSENEAYLGDKDGSTTQNQDFVLKMGVTYYWIAIAKEDE